MTFAELLNAVRLKSITLGPFTWEVTATPDSFVRISTGGTEVEPDDADSKIQKLNGLILALENFHSNPEGIYYIGQALINIDSFLDDTGITGEPADLTLNLISEIDFSARRIESNGMLEPYVSLTSVNKVKRALKQILAEVLTVRKSEI